MSLWPRLNLAVGVSLTRRPELSARRSTIVSLAYLISPTSRCKDEALLGCAPVGVESARGRDGGAHAWLHPEFADTSWCYALNQGFDETQTTHDHHHEGILERLLRG